MSAYKVDEIDTCWKYKRQGYNLQSNLELRNIKKSKWSSEQNSSD